MKRTISRSKTLKIVVIVKQSKRYESIKVHLKSKFREIELVNSNLKSFRNISETSKDSTARFLPCIHVV